ncbi:GtrA family protein [Marinomonas piezotolerans]|uniref:GtrA family protein n=1 Tax=Marinomonas piezotolerans TaxID=2213058 RepID=A0A370U7R4_9GAMM|nr:GtrA family protein [Marinomonas piezotolerans]RDL43814.1 GtrA family protein [Marinomonas piezotolerans]
MSKQFIYFGLVGTLGFLVDAGVLWLLSHWLPYTPARAISFWVAVTSNWWFNRSFTFRNATSKESPQRQWGRFFCASLMGFIPNWGVFAILMSLGDQLNWTGYTWYPYAAMVPGILLGMFINFGLSKVWVFKA